MHFFAVIYNTETQIEWRVRVALKQWEWREQPTGKLLVHSKESAVNDLLSAFQEVLMRVQNATLSQADVRIKLHLNHSRVAKP